MAEIIIVRVPCDDAAHAESAPARQETKNCFFIFPFFLFDDYTVYTVAYIYIHVNLFFYYIYYTSIETNKKRL